MCNWGLTPITHSLQVGGEFAGFGELLGSAVLVTGGSHDARILEAHVADHALVLADSAIVNALRTRAQQQRRLLALGGLPMQ